MAGTWATTSAANGVTKWHGRGHPQYDEAAATIGLDVGDRGVKLVSRCGLTLLTA